MTTPMTPEIAAKLNNERTQGKWVATDHKFPIGVLGDIFAGEDGMKFADCFGVCRCWHPSLSEKYIDSLSAMAAKNEGGKVIQANAEFIANSPAVYDAYIAQAKVVQELVEALDLVLPLAKGYVDKNQVGSNARYIEVADEALKKAGAL